MIYTGIDRETISSVATAVGFTSTKIPPTVTRVTYAIIQAISGDIRFAISGATPTTSLGMRLLQDASLEIWGSKALTNFRCIDDGGTAKLEVIYMGAGG